MSKLNDIKEQYQLRQINERIQELKHRVVAITPDVDEQRYFFVAEMLNEVVRGFAGMPTPFVSNTDRKLVLDVVQRLERKLESTSLRSAADLQFNAGCPRTSLFVMVQTLFDAVNMVEGASPLWISKTDKLTLVDVNFRMLRKLRKLENTYPEAVPDTDKYPNPVDEDRLKSMLERIQ